MLNACLKIRDLITGDDFFSRYLRNYFFVDLSYYFHLGVTFYINVLIFALFVAFIAVMAVTNRLRQNMYLTVKQLYRHGAGSEDTAKTLVEIGLGQNKTVKRLLSGDGQLTSVVHRVGAKRYTYEEYVAATKAGKMPKESIDFSTASFYLSEEAAPRVKRILNGYNVSTLHTLLLSLLLLVAYVGLSLLVPDLLMSLAMGI